MKNNRILSFIKFLIFLLIIVILSLIIYIIVDTRLQPINPMATSNKEIINESNQPKDAQSGNQDKEEIIESIENSISDSRISKVTDNITSETSKIKTSDKESTITKTTTKKDITTTKTSSITTTTTPKQIIISPDGRSGQQLDTPYSVNGIEVINKNHWVSRNYRPLSNQYQNKALREPAWSKFLEMKTAAANEGINLVHVSSYRTYELQEKLFRNYSYNYGIEAASRFSAKAGQSEHQTGLAIDITSGGGLVESFADTDAGKWLWENAYKFGFILRYPKGKESITGYMFEPWHYRYVGVDHAMKFGPNSNLTLEEYLGIN